MMKVTVNRQIIDTSCTVLKDLIVQLAIPFQGIAVAVNQEIVPLSTWDSVELSENDSITIIRVTCGG